MIPQWKIAALGALGGAVLSVLIVFGSAAVGLFPHKVDGPQLRAYLLAHPYLVQDMMAQAQVDQDAAAGRAQQAGLRAVGLKAFFDPKVAFVTGPVNAKATLVEFFDYNCVHCRNTLPALRKYYEAHRGDTRFSFIEFPVFGEMSVAAARAAIAARKQPDKYVAFSFAMMGETSAIDSNQIFVDAKAAGLDIPKLIEDMKDPQIDKTIKSAHALAMRLHIDGTPTFIFNGRVRAGELDSDGLRDVMAGRDI